MVFRRGQFFRTKWRAQQINSEQFGAFSGARPAHRERPSRLLWWSVVVISLHAAVIFCPPGRLQSALTWDLRTGIGVVVVVSTLLFLKLFLILKHRH